MYNFNNIKYTSLDQCINNSYSLFQTHSNHTTINSKNLVPLTSGKVNTSLGVSKYKKIRVLLDSGGSSTIMSSFLAKKLQVKRGPKLNWSTLASTISTCTKATVQFSLPKFFEDWVVEYPVHTIKTLKNYNLIIRQDLLHKLGIDINFSTKSCCWDNNIIPMRSPDSTINLDSSFAIEESGPIKAATKRLKKILDAKYEPVHIDKVVFGSHHLDSQQKKLLKILLKNMNLCLMVH